MLNVAIQNDGKIKIQSECSNTKEMRSNVNLLLAIISSMEMEEKANKKADDIPAQTIYYLYLKKVEDNNRLNTIKELLQQLNIPLRNAKAIVNTVADGREALLSQSIDKLFIENIKEALECKGCICEITQG